MNQSLVDAKTLQKTEMQGTGGNWDPMHEVCNHTGYFAEGKSNGEARGNGKHHNIIAKEERTKERCMNRKSPPKRPNYCANHLNLRPQTVIK